MSADYGKNRLPSSTHEGESRPLFLSEGGQASIRLLIIAEAGQVPALDFGHRHCQMTHATNAGSVRVAFEQQQFDVVLLAIPVQAADARAFVDYMTRQRCQWLLLGEMDASALPFLQASAFASLQPPFDADSLAMLCKSACAHSQLERTQVDLHNRLSQTMTMLKAITEYSSDRLYVLDHDGRFLFANDRFESLLGYEADQLIGEHYSHVIAPIDFELAKHVFSERLRDADFYHHDVEIHLKPAEVMLTQDKAIKVRMSSRSIYADADQSHGAQFLGMYAVVQPLSKQSLEGAGDDVHLQLYQDALTALPNRALFRDRLVMAVSQSKREKKMLAMMFLDLEKFKQVNDNFGHPCGDQILKMVATRLSSCLRSGDTLARFGGDEFTLLFPHVHAQKDASALARKIIERLRSPFQVDDKEINIGCSIGIALYPDADLYSEYSEKNNDDLVESIISHADKAMYHAKQSTKQKYRVFGKRMTQRAARHLEIEKDLRVALKENQIEVLYRPRWSLDEAKIVSVEANIRWQHPERGLVPYETFWSVAEQTGLIADLNERAWQQACKEVLRWEGQGLPDIRLSLKLFSVQVWQSNFPEMLLNTIASIGLSPSKVEVEIAEETAMQDIEKLAPKLRLIGRTGMTLTIGQFGANYFSLFHARKFPVHAFKINSIFTQEILSAGRDKTLVIQGIVAMAKALDIKVIAESVETRQQLAYLQKIGCDMAQGFFFGPPRTTGEVVELLQRQPKMF